jgi:ELAV like protein 2/3/4
MNGMKIDTKIIKVSLARPSSEGIKGANLYICGLKVETTQEQLEKLFTPYGKIISSKILTDPKTGILL